MREDDPVPGEIFMEKMRKAEIRKRNRQQREKCIVEAMAGAGWDREDAANQIKDTRERLGISYKDYIKLEMWSVPPELQEEKYNKELQRRERNKQRKEKCIASAMEAAGWDREFAEKQIADARKRLGISYNDYRKYKFCLIPEEKQQDQYEKILVEKAQEKAQK